MTRMLGLPLSGDNPLTSARSPGRGSARGERRSTGLSYGLPGARRSRRGADPACLPMDGRVLWPARLRLHIKGDGGHRPVPSCSGVASVHGDDLSGPAPRSVRCLVSASPPGKEKAPCPTSREAGRSASAGPSGPASRWTATPRPPSRELHPASCACYRCQTNRRCPTSPERTGQPARCTGPSGDGPRPGTAPPRPTPASEPGGRRAAPQGARAGRWS